MNNHISVDFDAHRLLAFQLERIVKNLFRAHLVAVEEIVADHDAALNKLYESLPPGERDKVALADYLDDDKVQRLRKRTLDCGNDSLREVTTLLKSFEVSLTNPKT